MTGIKHQFILNMGVRIPGAQVVHRASSNPQPIIVEKLTGKYMTPRQSLQGSMTQVVKQEHVGASGGDRNPSCSWDKMDQAVIVAKLDMKKKSRNPVAESGDDVEEVPKACVKTKQRSQVKVIEVSKRPQRNASVQISRFPPRKKSPEPTPLSQLPVTTNSPPTHDREPSSQEIERLQGDISKQLKEVRDLLENLVKECHNPKAVPSEEELEAPDSGQEQGALRALTRQVYIVQQQVLEVECKLNAMHNYKSATQLHANKLSWTKSRLTSAYRGAFKSLQMMTNHLRRFAGPTADPVFQLKLADLLTQLLQYSRTLLDLYLQLTSIFSKNYNSTCPELLELVDITDALQAEWQTQLEYKMKRLMSYSVQGGSTAPHLWKKYPSVKPTQKNFRLPLSLEVTPERKSVLRKPPDPSKPSRAVQKMSKKFPTNKKTSKSVIFPAHIQVHRKPHEAIPNQNKYAVSTMSSRMKSLRQLPAEEKSESPELWPFPSPTATESRDEEREELPGFDDQPLSRQPMHKMEKIGSSIIEELLSLDSKHREEQKTHEVLPAEIKTQETEGQQMKSMANVHFMDEQLKTIDLNLPPMEVLLHRLGEMENEQIQIRSRWASTRYHDTEAAAAEHKGKGSASTANHQPHSPSPISFFKKAGTSKTFELFQEQPQSLSSGEFPAAIRFTKKAIEKNYPPKQIEESEKEAVENGRMQFDCQPTQKTMATLDYLNKKPKRLFLSNKILKNINENRERFSNYLLNSAYHQVESFDPWRLTEELADSILDDCIQEVSEEMQNISHDLVHHLFNNEFIQLPTHTNTEPPSFTGGKDNSEYPPIAPLSLPS